MPQHQPPTPTAPNLAATGTVLARIYARADILLALFLFLLPIHFRLLFSSAPLYGFDTLDASWVVDLPFKLSRGVLLGRDVVFTYGPLHQLLTSAIALRLGVAIAPIEKSFWILPFCLSVVLVLGASRCLFPHSVWKRLPVLLATLVFSFAD